MSDFINLQTDGGTALGSDEYIINRSGVDFKQSHTQIVAGVTTLISTEESTRISDVLSLTNSKLALAGGVMTGALSLNAAPTSSLHATTKLYTDTADALLIPLAGGIMTGPLTLNADPSSALHSTTKQYADAGDSGRWKNSIPLDCGSNPNYPISSPGFTYRVSVAGRIGGATGPVVQIDDLIICHTNDATGGTHGAVGTSYFTLQANTVEASTTESGRLKIATEIQVKDGADDLTAVTPFRLRQTVADLVPGYTKIVTASLSVTTPTTTQSRLYLLTGTGTGAVAVSIPEISALAGNSNITLVFKDAGANATTNNITITSSGSDTIDGAATKVISTDSGSATLVNDGGTGWFVI
tara:strand:+ start:326 stop:1390 length:1065 start_codon:yes stop_codon:yes gene_type:complete